MERSPQKVKLEDFLRQGVDWDQLDALKPQARELGFNKYSWGRSQGILQLRSSQSAEQYIVGHTSSCLVTLTSHSPRYS